MTKQVAHRRHITDTRTLLSVTLQQPDEDNELQVVDLTGLVVKFKMINSAGTSIVAETTTGVQISSAAAGEVDYDFSSGAVTTAGTYYGYFVVYDGVQTDHFPVVAKELVIEIYGHR